MYMRIFRIIKLKFRDEKNKWNENLFLLHFRVYILSFSDYIRFVNETSECICIYSHVILMVFLINSNSIRPNRNFMLRKRKKKKEKHHRKIVSLSRLFLFLFFSVFMMVLFHSGIIYWIELASLVDWFRLYYQLDYFLVNKYFLLIKYKKKKFHSNHRENYSDIF